MTGPAMTPIHDSGPAATMPQPAARCIAMRFGASSVNTTKVSTNVAPTIATGRAARPTTPLNGSTSGSANATAAVADARKPARVIPIWISTVDALRDHRRRQLAERLAAGPAWQDVQTDHLGTSRTGLVFTWEDGSVLNPERLSTWFRQLRGGRAPTDQASRRAPLHSYASAGLANATGWHEVKVISERLGHANVAITIDTYSHVLPAADAETAHTLAKLILGGS
jgi:integrase